MAYTLPTAAQFKAFFPEFVAVEDDTVNLFISAAQNWVRDDWPEADWRLAILYLAAHLLIMRPTTAVPGSGVGGGGSTYAGDGETYIKSVKFGDRAVTYDVKKGASSSEYSGSVAVSADTFLGMTQYGEIFLQIRRRNVFLVAVI